MLIFPPARQDNKILEWQAVSGEIREQLERYVPFSDPPEGTQTAKFSRSRFVIRAELADGQGIYIKRYRLLDWKRQIASVVHSSKVQRELKLTCQALERKIPVPKVLAIAEIRQGFRLQESYIVHEAIEPSKSLEKLFQGATDRSSPFHQESFRSALVEFLVGIQQKGFKHEDLRMDHILVREPIQNPPQFAMIDLDGAWLSQGALGLSDIIHNLVQLNRSTWGLRLSARDRLQFLREFIKVHPRLVEERVSRLWRRIALESALRRGKYSYPMQFLYRSRYEIRGKIAESLRQSLKENS